MNYIFWFSENSNIYWHGIIMALAVIAAVLCAAGLRRLQDKEELPVWLTAVIALPLSYLLSKVSYWFFNKESFDGVFDAIFTPAVGGNSLFGAAFGVAAALIIVRFVCRIDDFTALLDAVTPAAMLGLCIGRLSGYFSIDDRGKILEEGSTLHFPFAIFDLADGNWHLSVFVLEALAAALIFVLTLALFIYIYKGNGSHIASGNVLLIALLLFGTTQGPLEGMRLDSLFMNSLGFVRIMQITALILILFVHVFYSVTSIKKAGLRLIHPVIWLACAGLLTLAFFMEFRIHSAVFARNYTVMVSCLMVISFLTVRMFAMTYSEPAASRGLMLTLGRRR